MAHVLSVSLDMELADLRGLILSSAGFTVTTAYSFDVAADNLNLKPDIFIVGHTLSTTQREELMAKWREVSPRTGIVLMSKTGFSECRVKPDVTFDIYEGPETLISDLKALENKVKSSRE